MRVRGMPPLPAALIAVALAAAPAAAQAPAETPEQVAQQYLQATRDTDWARVAGLLHPDALAQLHGFFAPILQCQTPEAAEARRQIFGITSSVQAARTSDSALAVSLFRGAAGGQRGMASVLRTARLQVLGDVPEGRDTVHVVSRLSLTYDSLQVTEMEVVSLARSGPTWRVLLKSDFTALAVALRRLCSPRGT